MEGQAGLDFNLQVQSYASERKIDLIIPFSWHSSKGNGAKYALKMPYSHNIIQKHCFYSAKTKILWPLAYKFLKNITQQCMFCRLMDFLNIKLYFWSFFWHFFAQLFDFAGPKKWVWDKIFKKFQKCTFLDISNP